MCKQLCICLLFSINISVDIVDISIFFSFSVSAIDAIHLLLQCCNLPNVGWVCGFSFMSFYKAGKLNPLSHKCVEMLWRILKSTASDILMVLLAHTFIIAMSL